MHPTERFKSISSVKTPPYVLIHFPLHANLLTIVSLLQSAIRHKNRLESGEEVEFTVSKGLKRYKYMATDVYVIERVGMICWKVQIALVRYCVKPARYRKPLGPGGIAGGTFPLHTFLFAM